MSLKPPGKPLARRQPINALHTDTAGIAVNPAHLNVQHDAAVKKIPISDTAMTMIIKSSTVTTASRAARSHGGVSGKAKMKPAILYLVDVGFKAFK